MADVADEIQILVYFWLDLENDIDDFGKLLSKKKKRKKKRKKKERKQLNIGGSIVRDFSPKGVYSIRDSFSMKEKRGKTVRIGQILPSCRRNTNLDTFLTKFWKIWQFWPKVVKQKGIIQCKSCKTKLS